MTQPIAPATANRSRKPFSAGRVILWLLLLLVLLGLFLLGRTGLVPGLSAAVGAAKPRDLGVRPAPEQFAAVVERLGYGLQNDPTATDPTAYQKVYAGQMRVDQVLTESELSSLLTYNHVSWWPFSEVQLKVHENGTLEASLNVITQNIPWEQVPEGILRQLPDRIPASVPVYLKGRLEPLGGARFQAEIERLEVGRVAVPDSVVNDQTVTEFINGRAAAIPGFAVESLTFQDGQLHFSGTFPQSFTRVPIKP